MVYIIQKKLMLTFISRESLLSFLNIDLLLMDDWENTFDSMY